MRPKLFQPTVALTLGAACALPAAAQVKPDVLVEQRQAVMTLQGKYFNGHLRPTAQGKIAYDGATVARNVGFLDALSKMAWDGFAPSTREIKSRAAPAVFTDTAKFKEAQDRFQSEVGKLVEVTRKGDEGAIKQQVLAVDKACGSCHDTFRERR
ncbi:MAG: c-type cytochrome [Burkholderiales bacterium]